MDAGWKFLKPGSRILGVLELVSRACSKLHWSRFSKITVLTGPPDQGYTTMFTKNRNDMTRNMKNTCLSGVRSRSEPKKRWWNVEVTWNASDNHAKLCYRFLQLRNTGIQAIVFSVWCRIQGLGFLFLDPGCMGLDGCHLFGILNPGWFMLDPSL